MSPSVTVSERGQMLPAGQRYNLSVVIVSLNTCEVLRRCLTALETESKELSLEVIVVDNGSRDGSVEMLARDFPHLRLIDAGRNLGFAAANNLVLHWRAEST